MPEVNIEKTTTVKDKVFFPGKAVLSDKEAEVFEANQDAAESPTPKAAEKGSSSSKTDKK